VLSLDGQEISGQTIPLLDDHQEHFVEMKVLCPVDQFPEVCVACG
jgi:hypothetical protein